MTLSTQNQICGSVASINSLETVRKTCEALMQTRHYAKLGQEGIFAIVAKARSLNIDPLDALNGGLYCVQGKVEMSSQMMNLLIRQSGHSVTKDPKSDDTVCILHGKRCDNGDLWTESFSIEEAKRAGIYNEKSPWGKYPRDMLFARALSRLARQLFPDVIKGCYVEGEISQAIQVQHQPAVKTAEVSMQDDADVLTRMLSLVPEHKDKVEKFLQESFGSTSLAGISMDLYSKIRSSTIMKIEEKNKREEIESLPELDEEDNFSETEEAL